MTMFSAPLPLEADCRNSRPGKSEVILNKVGHGINLTAIEVFKPNAPHKPPGRSGRITSSRVCSGYD